MRELKQSIIDLYHKETTDRKIEKFKQREIKQKQKREKKLEKLEDREFAKVHKELYTDKQTKISLSIVYKVSILTTLFLTPSYFIYSIIKKQILLFNSILFTLIVIGFILTSTIQKKKERKIMSIATSALLILWMLLHL